ncbi:3-oxoadipate enol-lactonase [bacterium]|nr:3-oxoadipate enol-lactonase [bacterium]
MLVYLPDLRLNARLEGPDTAPPLVFSHALGTNLSIWDGVLRHLPGYRTLTYDQRGHGLSDVPPAPYAMGALIRDAERLMDHFEIREAVFIGVSLGGMVAQGLAVKRLDLVRGLVLSNTAARIGTAEIWAARARQIRDEGFETYADGALQRQLGPRWRDSPHAPYLRDILTRTDPEGWAGCAAAIGGSDFYTTTAGLRLPVLAVAGGHDGTTPPDLVRETAELIPGHRFYLMPRAGHFPMVEHPAEYAALLQEFLTGIGHV